MKKKPPLAESSNRWSRASAISIAHDRSCVRNDVCSSSGANFSCRKSYDLQGVLSYGIRFLGEKLSVDLALWNPTGDFIFPGIPYVAFAVKF